MLGIIAFVTFDMLGVVFLLWCLYNLHREGRARGKRAKVLRIDAPERQKTGNVVSIADARPEVRLGRKQAR